MSEQIIWKRIKKLLQEKSSGNILHSALNSAVLESSFSEGQKYFQLKVPSALHQELLKAHFPHIQKHIQNLGGKLSEIEVKKTFPASPPSPRRSFYPPPKPRPQSAFLSKWTFSSFIQGPQNLFAFSLAKNVAENPGQKNSNPLFIYGPSGLGKTHLLQAIGNALEQRKSPLKALYLPAERFFNDCIKYIRSGNMPAFRSKYRHNIDVLLLDDIQILGKGESIQEEFFHTFESLKFSGSQIVLAGDTKPKDIKGLKERIKTRFEGGVIADIEAPDKDTKKAIIKSKVRSLMINLSEESISFVANIPSSSIRETEGHLNKIKMFCELQNKSPSLALLQKLFPEKSSPSLFFEEKAIPPKQHPLIKSILQEVCHKFHVRPQDLKSSSRSRRIVPARNTAMFLIRKKTGLPLKDIGKIFGKRNHSTVLNALKKAQKEQSKN